MLSPTMLRHVVLRMLALSPRSAPFMSETPPPPEENQLPALPASTDALTSETHRLEVDGAAATLDELGPVVVTEAGQLRYISNWAGMTKDEQEATQRIIAKRNAQRLARLRGGGAVQTTSVGTHVYGGFECSFRRKPAAPGYEGRPPLMLIHPLGIGLASWFWDNYVDEWTGAELFVPDLIGCGASEVWDPASRGLHVPLDWERQIQSLWREHVRRPMVVVSQGGIAPLAVTLASRQTDLWQGKRAVRAVVLISPPEVSTLADGLGEAEVTRNFQLLSITLGRPFLYRALSSRFFIDFFSRQFLFAPAEGASKDESKEQLFTRFIDACCEETSASKRWPVLAFNAGLVGVRGLREELSLLAQPSLVLCGNNGKPLTDGGAGYELLLPRCRVLRLPEARNVLPWEAAPATCAAIAAFCEGGGSFRGIRWPPDGSDPSRS